MLYGRRFRMDLLNMFEITLSSRRRYEPLCCPRFGALSRRRRSRPRRAVTAPGSRVRGTSAHRQAPCRSTAVTINDVMFFFALAQLSICYCQISSYRSAFWMRTRLCQVGVISTKFQKQIRPHMKYIIPVFAHY